MVELFDVALPLLLFIAGVALVAAEAFIPGAHFIVIGAALLVAGLLGMLFPPLAAPLALAITTLLAGLVGLYVYRRLDFYGGGSASSISDSESLRGGVGRVTEQVTEHDGEVKLEDGGFNPYYRARTTRGAIEEGERVIVVDPGGGNVVTVESLSAVEDGIDRELAAERARSTRGTDAETEDA